MSLCEKATYLEIRYARVNHMNPSNSSTHQGKKWMVSPKRVVDIAHVYTYSPCGATHSVILYAYASLCVSNGNHITIG